MSTALEHIEARLSPRALSESMVLHVVLPIASFVLVTVALVFAFLIVPDEKVMGAVQRIFYFHVAAAMACYLGVAVLLLGSVVFLLKRKAVWDFLAEAGANVALLFATQVLATGMIWGHSAWNTWWRWEPRLVSFLILWLILLSYWLLRRLAQGHSKKENYAAVVGIIAAINVPIVVYSVKLLNASEQLHPQVVAKSGLGDPLYVLALVLSTFAVIVLAFWLLGLHVQYCMLAQVERRKDYTSLTSRGDLGE